jgi:hypothetical protein
MKEVRDTFKNTSILTPKKDLYTSIKKLVKDEKINSSRKTSEVVDISETTNERINIEELLMMILNVLNENDTVVEIR